MYYCNHVSVVFCQLCFTRINEWNEWIEMRRWCGDVEDIDGTGDWGGEGVRYSLYALKTSCMLLGSAGNAYTSTWLTNRDDIIMHDQWKDISSPRAGQPVALAVYKTQETAMYSTGYTLVSPVYKFRRHQGWGGICDSYCSFNVFLFDC